MRKFATTLGMMLLLAACGDKKAVEPPVPVAPSGVEKGGTPPPLVADKAEAKGGEKEPAAEVKPVEPAEAKPVEKEPAAKLVEPAVEAKPVEPAAEVKPVEPVAEVKPVEVEAEPAGNEGAGPSAVAPELEVIDSAVTSEVVDRLPSDRKTSWKIGEDATLIGWFELKNPGAKVELELVWKKDGKENWRFPTSAGTGKNWRTWAEKRIGKRDAGQWTVELVDANGYVYGSLSYTVE